MNDNNPNDELDTILSVLDQAMMSDDARVQDALRRLMVTSALINSQQDVRVRMGPLREVVKENQALRHRLDNVEHELQGLKQHLRRVSLVPDEINVISPVDHISLQSIDLSGITGTR